MPSVDCILCHCKIAHAKLHGVDLKGGEMREGEEGQNQKSNVANATTCYQQAMEVFSKLRIQYPEDVVPLLSVCSAYTSAMKCLVEGDYYLAAEKLFLLSSLCQVRKGVVVKDYQVKYMEVYASYLTSRNLYTQAYLTSSSASDMCSRDGMQVWRCKFEKAKAEVGFREGGGKGLRDIWKAIR